jgi:threonine/homoserine efflux transporter RhtA
MGQSVMWCILLSGPGAALVASILCRRYAVLLWLGLACCALMHMLRLCRDLYPEDSFGYNLTTFAGVFFMLSGLVLLAGGAVRWGMTRSRPAEHHRPTP